MMKLVLVTCALAVGVALAGRRYDGHKVVSVMPETVDDLHKLKAIERTMDVWRTTTSLDKPAHVMVDAAQEARLRAFFEAHKVNTFIDNVQTQIDREAAEMAEQTAWTRDMSLDSFPLNKYHTYEEIIAWMQQLESTYSSIVSLGTAGQTFEHYNQTFIKIGKSNGQTKPGFWIDGCIHAREWIATATTVWTINELVTKYGSDASITKMLDTMDFYILPVFNVDGYKYTFEHERLWRKTRTGPIDGCYGADPNRNWDYEWAVAGASGQPCSEIYEGHAAFSEPCVKNVADYLQGNKAIKGYMNLHSYSEEWFYPYAWRAHTYPSNHQQQAGISKAAVEAIRAVHGTSYDYGSPADILYAASGSSFDWTQGQDHIMLSFGMELRPGQHSFYGFQLPANQIVATAEETWAGLQLVAQAVMETA